MEFNKSNTAALTFEQQCGLDPEMRWTTEYNFFLEPAVWYVHCADASCTSHWGKSNNQMREQARLFYGTT
jgi:hypothetical protein